MSTQLKLRRGTTAQHSTFTGAEGEVTVDTTKDTLVVHDGTTAGGVPLATEATAALKLNTASPSYTGTLTGTGGASIQGLTVGRGAGAVSTNTAVGASALAANTSGTNNTAMGVSTLAANTTGIFNSAFGNAPLTSNTTGSYNTGLGMYALVNNTTANNNTAVGYTALFSSTTAANNTAVGHQAGYSQTTSASGGFSVFMGAYAGYSSTGFGNTFVGGNGATGYGAGFAMTTGSNNAILGGYSGNQGGLDIRTASNYIVLSDGAGNPRAYWNSSGYLKASNSGTVISATGAYHEIASNSDGQATLVVYNSSANQVNDTLQVISTRNTSNGSYNGIIFYNNTGGVYKFKVADSGNVTNTNNSYGAISDVRLKENITDATPKLEKLNRVRVVNYNLIGSEQKQLGVIAQELEQIFPGIVEESLDKDADGNPLGTTTKSVKYSVFVPMLIKAIQEQQALITQLQADVATLKGQP